LLEKENTLHLLFSLSTHSVDCDTKSHLQDPLNTTFFTTPKLHLLTEASIFTLIMFGRVQRGKIYARKSSDKFGNQSALAEFI